jgi:uncharacterized membrane protein YeaQ/YmgE (transglycosylase-associated protein family)
VILVYTLFVLAAGFLAKLFIDRKKWGFVIAIVISVGITAAFLQTVSGYVLARHACGYYGRF